MVGGCRRWQLLAVIFSCLYVVRRTSALTVMEGLPFGVCVLEFCVICELSLWAVVLLGVVWRCVLIRRDSLLHILCASYLGLSLVRRVGSMRECFGR